MEPIAGAVPGSGLPGPEIETLQFGEEIQRLMAVPPPQQENASSFTALLELPPTQAMELLHLTPPETPLPAGGVLFPADAGGALKVKSEPAETDSNPNSSPAKRKEREKKGKVTSAKKSKTEEVKEDADKLPYVHVRARRGQATDSHSLAERVRREKINARMKLLQELVPGCNKISGTALVLDEIINHVQSLQRQVEFLSMRLATVDPRIDSNLDHLLATESLSLMQSNFSNMAPPFMWPEFPINGNRQQFPHQMHFDVFHQPGWGREEDNHTFITPEASLMSCNSSANSASLHTGHVKTEL